MILSEIKKLKNSTATNAQRVIVKCDECSKEWESALIYQNVNYVKHKKDLCGGCKRKKEYKTGIRNSDKLIAYNKSLKNKTLEEILGKDKAAISRQKNSIANSGKNNANFGGKYSHGFGESRWLDKYKGKTWDEFYGIEKSKILKQKMSNANKGEKNNMYGKPSPQGSGNGWCGWYNGWFFRSLKELSYMIYVIERFNLKWENGEKQRFKINYVDFSGEKHTYHPDFFIEDKFLVEIKPKHLWNSDGVKRKKEAAIEFCKLYKFKYKLTECQKQITPMEIKKLIDENKLIFIKRYQEKFNNLYLINNE
jgi:hypothetical protein